MMGEAGKLAFQAKNAMLIHPRTGGVIAAW